MVLFYSKSFGSINAFVALAKYTHSLNVFTFTDRVRFLACAVLIRKAILIIDAIEYFPDDIHWLYGQLSSRVEENRLYFIAPQFVLNNRYGCSMNTITTLSDLRKKLISLQKNNASYPQCSLSQHLKECVSKQLGESYYNLLLYEQHALDISNDINEPRERKTYLNRRHQINKKLNLRTLQEYSSMIMMMDLD